MPESRDRAIEPVAPTPADREARELQRRVQALAEEARNVLVVVHAYSELLQERYGDASFRAELQALLWEGVARVDQTLTQLETLAGVSLELDGRGDGQHQESLVSAPDNRPASERWEPAG